MYSGKDFKMNAFPIVLIKNLDKSIDRDDALRESFSIFGNVLSCGIVTDHSGNSKGFGYVQFGRNESAQNAINALNGKIIKNKKLYVGLFQRKHDRFGSAFSIDTQIQALHLQMRPRDPPIPISARTRMYEQPLFYGKFSPPPPWEELPLQKSAPMPPCMPTRPSHVQRQQFYVPPTTGTEQNSQSLATTALVNAHPDLQMTILRLALFSCVYQEEPEAANEVTNMILEMYPSAVPYLIESPNHLKIKIDETMDLLRNVGYQNLDDISL